MKTLALVSKKSIVDKFWRNWYFSWLDELLRYCQHNQFNEDIITDINVKTLAHIKNCKKQIDLTNRYLKENKLLAVPFDKGIEICLVSHDLCKLKGITNLPQFTKVIFTRENEKHPSI